MQRLEWHFSVGAFLIAVICSHATDAGGPHSSVPAQRAQRPKNGSLQKAVATKPRYYNLQSYLKAVVDRDPGLVADRLAQMSSDDTVRSTRAAYLPHLTADANLGLLNGSVALDVFAQTNTGVPVQVRTVDFGGYAIAGPTLTMPFFKDGTFLGINTPPAVTMKKAEGRALAMKARLTEQEIIFKATDIYLRAINSNDETELLRQHLEMVQKQTDISKEKGKSDLVSSADVALAETKLKDARFEYETARELALYSFLELASLLGFDNPSTVHIDTRYPQPKALPSITKLIVAPHLGHPAIGLQQARIDAAKAELALRRIKLWPSGEIRSSYRWGNDFENQGRDRWLSVLDISAPVFDFGELRYAAKAADLKWQEEKSRLAKASDDLRQSIVDAFTHIQQVAELKSRNAILIEERKTAFNRLQELDKFGRAPVLDLIESEENLVEAQRAQERLSLELLLSYAFLEKVTAGEWKWISGLASS